MTQKVRWTGESRNELSEILWSIHGELKVGRLTHRGTPLTAQRLAELLSVDPGTVSRWLNRNGEKPTSKSLPNIAQVHQLLVSIDDHRPISGRLRRLLGPQAYKGDRDDVHRFFGDLDKRLSSAASLPIWNHLTYEPWLPLELLVQHDVIADAVRSLLHRALGHSVYIVGDVDNTTAELLRGLQVHNRCMYTPSREALEVVHIVRRHLRPSASQSLQDIVRFLALGGSYTRHEIPRDAAQMDLLQPMIVVPGVGAITFLLSPTNRRVGLAYGHNSSRTVAELHRYVDDLVLIGRSVARFTPQEDRDFEGQLARFEQRQGPVSIATRVFSTALPTHDAAGPVPAYLKSLGRSDTNLRARAARHLRTINNLAESPVRHLSEFEELMEFVRHGRLGAADNFATEGTAVQDVPVSVRMAVVTDLRKWIARNGFEMRFARSAESEPAWLLKQPAEKNAEAADSHNQDSVFLITQRYGLPPFSDWAKDPANTFERMHLQLSGDLAAPFQGYFEAKWAVADSTPTGVTLEELFDTWTQHLLSGEWPQIETER